MAALLARWSTELETPVTQRRGELLTVCVGMLAGWIGLAAMALVTPG
jgi:hypothetical protein